MSRTRRVRREQRQTAAAEAVAKATARSAPAQTPVRGAALWLAAAFLGAESGLARVRAGVRRPVF